MRQPVVENFAELRPKIIEPSRLGQLKEIENWSLETYRGLVETFEQRHNHGFVRECHGDLHLGNIIQWRGAMTPFDCIEFNPAFRWIDVMNEVAFLIMDLDDHGRPDLASRFLNAYLESTGDYEGLSVLSFYLVYRAVVRAKVDALRVRQTGLAVREQEQLTTEWHGYLDLAEQYTQPREVTLTITHGLSGSGKTTGTQSLIERLGAIRVRSDVERKRLFGMGPFESGADAINVGIYSEQSSEQTYDRLATLAGAVIEAGFSVIVDATFLKRAQRQRFHQLASDLDVPYRIVAFDADEQMLRERILHRRQDSDASDATVEVLDHQISILEALSHDEQPFVISSAAPGRKPESKPDRVNTAEKV